MNVKRVACELANRGICFVENVCLAKHSTLRIGGVGRLAVFPKTVEQFKESIEIVKGNNLKHVIVGRGSNLLFSDKGYDGAIIFTEKINSVRRLADGVIYADAGATLEMIAAMAKKNSLSGAEFMHGIPGSCGGAVFMNAGAYGGEISNVLEYSDYYDTETGKFGRLDRCEHNFSYRHSIYCEKRSLAVIGACFHFEKGDRCEIEKKMCENMKSRKEKQPLEYPNAGSIFKRPVNGIAAKMIDECGLKGRCVGGAEVSTKHAGFIINKGGATAKDILELSRIIRETVKDKFGVELEFEIQYVE